MSVETRTVGPVDTGRTIHHAQSLQLAPTGFPHVLYNILETEEQSIITWTSSGQAFGIQDMAAFTSQVLPKHFKHAKFPSFQRQLNLYGFRKIVRGREAGGYMHKDFQRGRLDLLKNVRRGVVPACPEKYERKIYGSGGRAEDSSDSDPELVPPPRGTTSGLSSISHSRSNNRLNPESPSSSDAISLENASVSEAMTLDAAAEQLRRLSASTMPFTAGTNAPTVDIPFNFHVPNQSVDNLPGFWPRMGSEYSSDYRSTNSSMLSNYSVSVKQEPMDSDKSLMNRRQRSTNGMKKLFPSVRSAGQLPINHSSTGNFHDREENVPMNTPIQSRTEYNGKHRRDSATNFSNVHNSMSLDIMQANSRHNQLSPQHLSATPKRSSICAMVASIEQKLQEEGVGVDSNGANALPIFFSSPTFTSQLKELANELQTSAHSYDSKTLNGDRNSPLAGLELLHTTAVRRRSSLSELCAAANRRGSLTDLYQGLMNSSHGDYRPTSSRKHRRISAENDSQHNTKHSSQDTHFFSTDHSLGDTLRPSIQSAFSLLTNSTDCSFLKEGNENKYQFQSQLHSSDQQQQWMNDYYLDDAVRDLQKVEEFEQSGDCKTFPDISQSKLRASVYVLLSVLSTAGGELAATPGTSNSSMSYHPAPFSPQYNMRGSENDYQDHSNIDPFFYSKNDIMSRDIREKCDHLPVPENEHQSTSHSTCDNNTSPRFSNLTGSVERFSSFFTFADFFSDT